MRTQKKAVETKKPSKKTERLPVDSEGYYVIPHGLLMEWRALDAECRHAHLELRVASQELEMLLAKQPEIQKKMTHKASMITEAANKKNALTEVLQTIEQMFAVRAANISIDDVTGRIHQLVDGRQEMEAIKPPAPKKPARRGAKAKTT